MFVFASTWFIIAITNRHWNKFQLLQIASEWYKRMHKRKSAVSEHSDWWSFITEYKMRLVYWLQTFRNGRHQFSPMKQYRLPNEIIPVWSYLDRLIIHLILTIIKPTFKYIISPLCLHLAGPSIIKTATAQIKEALNSGQFNYCLRIDIRSYYASIDHRLLCQQIKQHFADPIMRKYLTDIVTIAVDRDGQVLLPTKGIPRGSALSPFFGALYLSGLDLAFTERKGIFYLRYMDDIIILTETKRQYTAARKRMFKILKELQLQISPHKTRMGTLRNGFHFLGVNFEVSRNPQSKTQVVTVDIHSRTSRRALDKAIVLSQYAVHPANIQHYLTRWAAWWHLVTGLKKEALVYKWVCCAMISTSMMCLGRGLLIGSPFYLLTSAKFQ